MDALSNVLPCAGHIEDLNRAWESVLHLGKRVAYARNAVIPHQQSTCMYYLAQGTVVISYTSPCGRERLALYIKPGCIFNEARSVSGYEPGGRFVCLTDVEVYGFPQKILENVDFICRYPALISNLIRSMGLKMLVHYSFLAGMGLGAPVAHLCNFILQLARKNKSMATFPCGMTQQEVADLLGVHRTTLARAIRQLKELGIISTFTHKTIHVNNFSMLTKLATQQ